MKWIQFHDVPKSEEHKLKHFLKKSHRLVSLGLTKKKQKELGLNQG
jgi:predicted DNA-binding protein (MmcQ/YjbR family)